MRLKNQILISLLTILFVFTFSSLLWAESPGEVIVETVNKGLEILRDPSLQDVGKISERRQKMWDILTPVFNFEEISRRALGQHWKNRTAKERKEFILIFTNNLKNTYLYKTDSYANEKIIYLRENRQGNCSKVQTNFVTTEGKKIAVDYSMHRIDNTWKVYDITIEGVSMVSNYRSQFNSILHKSSFEELIQKLKEKEKELDEI